MSPPNFLAGAAFVKLYWNSGNFLTINVLGARVIGSPTFDQNLANSIGAGIKSAFTTNLATHMATTTSLVRVGVRDWRTANQPEYRDTGAAVPGTAPTSDPLPVQTALAVTLRTAFTGRSFRGRVYLGGWAESANTAAGLQLAAAGTAAIAFLNACDTAMTGQGLDLAVISRPAERVTIVKNTFHSDGTMSTETISDIEAKAGSVNPVTALENRSQSWESQRRRANGRGTVPAVFDASRYVELAPA